MDGGDRAVGRGHGALRPVAHLDPAGRRALGLARRRVGGGLEGAGQDVDHVLPEEEHLDDAAGGVHVPVWRGVHRTIRTVVSDGSALGGRDGIQ